MRYGQLSVEFAGAVVASLIAVSAHAQCETWYHPQYGVGSFGVGAIAEYNGDLIVGGSFDWAGYVDANNIARWDGKNWHPLASGVNDFVHTLIVFDNQLFAGGAFNVAGGLSSSSGTARWDGTQWIPIDDGASNICFRLVVYQGELIASTKNGLQRWNGTSWEHLGQGLGEIAPATTVFNDLLLFAGLEGQVFQWDGTLLQPMGGLIGSKGDAVSSLVVYHGELYAGVYTWDGLSGRVAKWNGTVWNTFAEAAGDVFAMAVYQDKLVVAGPLWNIGGVDTVGVGEWDGQKWSAELSGLSPYVYVLGAYGNQLAAGGSFNLPCCNLSGGGNIALWQPCPPCTVDLTGDSQVNVADLLVVINAWGPCAACAADVNGDGVVNVADMLAILNGWGACTPP